VSQPLVYPRPASLGQLGGGHNLVESSAGTGKTFLLEHLFVDLILTRGLTAEQILVVTFTEKATAELVLRLRKLVSELLHLRPGHAKSAQAAGEAGEVWLIDDRAKKLLGEALVAFDRSNIFTIHGFCQRVLREHAFVQGRLFDEELIGADVVFAEAFHEVLRTEITTDAGLATMVKAWLGKGKTIAGLHEVLSSCRGTAASALRPAFDEDRLAAAMSAWQPGATDDELKTRLKAAKIHGATINAMLRRLDVLSEILARCAGDPIRFLAEMDAAAGSDLDYLVAKWPDKKADASLVLLGQRLGELAACLVPLQAAVARRLLPAVQERAARRKRAAGYFDFQDMLELVEQALADPGPAGRALLASLRERYQHALIDEFQDTDEIQWSIFRRIFVEAGDHHALTAIGDPKQAIYGFRGANVFTYLDAREFLKQGGARVLPLERNFRSTAELIAATNLIFDAKADFFRRSSGITYDRPATCGQPLRKLVDVSGRPAPPVVVFDVATSLPSLPADHARATGAAAIVAELRELLSPDCPLRLRDGKHEKRLRAADVFILTFTNSDSKAMGSALGEAGLPFAFYKQEDLFETSEAREVLDVLRAVCAPDDRGWVARALLTRFFALDLTEIAAVVEAGHDDGPTRLLLRLADLAATSEVPTFFASLVEQTGVLRREIFAGGGERGLTNIVHVLEILQGQWASTHASLPELVDLLEGYVRGSRKPPGHEGDLQRLETDGDAVQILTVYKAKGLEADVVFVYGGTGEKSNDKTHSFHDAGKRMVYVGKPDAQTKQRIDDEVEDERSRLLYVATTRARYRLYLAHYPPAYATLKGPYARMNQRLTDLLAGGESAGLAGFDVRRVDADAFRTNESSAACLSPTEPDDPNLYTIPSPPADVVAIREKRRGFLVTSYTGVKRARAGMAPVEEVPQLVDPGEPPGHDLGSDALPGGAETGVFLHEILAVVSLPELAAVPSFSAWFATPKVSALLERLRRRFARPAAELPVAGRLVHAAYTTPVCMGEAVIPALASAKQALREMEFLYPMPEHDHPLLTASVGSDHARAWKIERGAVKGFIDLLFEHEGRIHVCDWKSDILPSYDAATLARHCEQHYEVQARLYTMAALRFASIASPTDYAARFGGIVFYFLRGKNSGDPRQGLHFLKPTWEQILSWETEMLGRPFWGIAP